MTSKEIDEIQKIIIENLQIIIGEAKNKEIALNKEDIKQIAKKMQEELEKQLDKNTELPKEKVQQMASKMTEQFINSMSEMSVEAKKETIRQKNYNEENSTTCKKENEFKKRLKLMAATGIAGLAIGTGVTIAMQPENQGYHQSHIGELLQGETDEFTQNWKDIEQDYNDYQILIAQDKSDLSQAQKAEIQVLEERLAKSKENLQKLLLKVTKNALSQDIGKEVRDIYIINGGIAKNRYVYNDGTVEETSRTEWPEIKNKEVIGLMKEYNKLTSMEGLKEYTDSVAIESDGKEKSLEYQKELAQKNMQIFEKISEVQEKIIQNEKQQIQQDDEMEKY